MKSVQVCSSSHDHGARTTNASGFPRATCPASVQRLSGHGDEEFRPSSFEESRVLDSSSTCAREDSNRVIQMLMRGHYRRWTYPIELNTRITVLPALHNEDVVQLYSHDLAMM